MQEIKPKNTMSIFRANLECIIKRGDDLKWLKDIRQFPNIRMIQSGCRYFANPAPVHETAVTQ